MRFLHPPVWNMHIGLIPAAGMARRLKIDTPKELIIARGKPVIDYGIEHLIAAKVDKIVIVIRHGKEAIRTYIEKTYPHLPTQFVYQTGLVGNLINAIYASYEAIQGHIVYFCMADVMMLPNPFLTTRTGELTVLCQEVVGAAWRHLGVVDVANGRIVDKPSRFYGRICWGALIWQPSFTEKIMKATDFTAVMNSADWNYIVNIDEFVDIGIDKTLILPLSAKESHYAYIG